MNLARVIGYNNHMNTDSALAIAAFKNFSYVAIFIASVQYLGFNPESLSILSMLMTLDMMTGIARAAVVEGGKAIRSAIFRKGILAKFLLFTGLLSVALMAKGLGFESTNYAQGIINVLMLGEAYSTLGNIHSAKTGQPKVEFDAVVWMLNKVKRIIDKVIK
jgi:hypothetical protein